MDPSTRRQFLATSAAIAATGSYVASGIAAQPGAHNTADAAPKPAEAARHPAFGQGVMLGEVTDTSVIVQARVTLGTTLIDGETYDDGDAMRDGDLPGAEAEVLFKISEIHNPLDIRPVSQKLVPARKTEDSIARAVFDDLLPGQQYRVDAYLNEHGLQLDNIRLMKPENGIAHFKTHPGKDTSAPVQFVMSSCMNYDKFTGSDGSDNSKGYTGEDRALGYPAAATVLKLKPDFVIFAGDVVYYDKKPRVQTLADMRAKWHRQNNLPRMIALHAAAPGYWMKDDHDHRNNDSDATRDYFPSHELGIATFREQCPILAQDDDTSPTYRTHRVSKDLQVWMVEGRDYRSPNKSPDGPDKTIWGEQQEAWLKKTLLESDATYKIIISPTPLVGPDDGYKADNHTNPRGFKAEGEAFKQWGKDNRLWGHTFLMCGDRHWQYHSIDPTGAHEFSCGAFNDENSRMGRKPGDKGSTDPDGLVTQLFTSPKPTGGFIHITCQPAGDNAAASIRFDYFDDLGEKLYSYQPGKP